jgi:anti-sigma regulatory factor (Ser/Thr protein kinase)
VIIGNYCLETYFKPLDIMSGDIYGSINLNDGRYLLYIVDAMGKGLSASVTALQSSSFINHAVELSLIKNDFDINKTIASFVHFIRDRLMDEEALCIIFALVNTNNDTISIANYGLPPVYIENTDGSVWMVKPNNLPLMRCTAENNFQDVDISGMSKLMIMSDGLIETTTTESGLYMDHLKTHMSASVTKKHFLSMVNSKIKTNDDDITFFYLKKCGFPLDDTFKISIDSNTKAISECIEKLTEMMQADGIPFSDAATVEYALTEIMMNALEHGNLGIGYKDKQVLIARGTYDDFIMEKIAENASNANKKIHVGYAVENHRISGRRILYLSVEDEGMGFSPANIFKYHSFDGNLCHVDKQSYNGRGIFISDTIMDGLYYNEKGNQAYMLKLI